MRAVKVSSEIGSDHTLQLQLPEDIGEGPAEVIVLVADPAPAESAKSQPGTLDEFLAGPGVDRRFIRSQAEIDDYLREERGDR